jgi:hypothetical protein
MDVVETVDAISGEVGNGGAQLLVFGLFGLIVGGADGIEARHLQLIGTVKELAIEIDVALHLG